MYESETNWVAGGTISPYLCVKADSSAANTVVVASSQGEAVIGVARNWQRDAPGLSGSDSTIHVTSGDPVAIQTIPGKEVEVLVPSGTTLTQGSRAMTNSTGGAITYTSQAYVIGYCRRTCIGPGVTTLLWSPHYAYA